jgi:hypothetical protein
VKEQNRVLTTKKLHFPFFPCFFISYSYTIQAKATGNMMVHLTCATDPENVAAVFDACKAVIFTKVLAETGL